MHQKVIKYWYLVYLVLLVLGIFYVRDVLKRDDVKIEKSSNEKTAIEQKIVNVDITIQNGINSRSYKTKLKNIDSVYDAFDEIRNDDGFYYEVTSYLYGTQVNCINRICSSEGNHWYVYKDGEDITSAIKETNLEDDTLIELKLEKTK